MSLNEDPVHVSETARLAAKAMEAAARHTTGETLHPEPSGGLTADFFAEQAQRERERREEMWPSRVPPVYGLPVLDDVRKADLPDDLIADLVAWSANPSVNLVLFGAVGVGKTHLAYALLHEPHLAGMHVRGVTMIDLLEAQRPKLVQAEEPTWLRTCDLLLIDDIGTEKPSEWTDAQVYALIHHRWEQLRPTVLTANLDIAGIREVLGPRAYSRIVDNALVLEVTGTDRRRNRKANR